MKLANTIKKDYFQLALTIIALISISVFFIAQPIQHSTTTSCAIILWLIGLGFLPHYVKNKAYTKQEILVYGSGLASFFICLASWLNSPYFDGIFNIIEPDARFLLFSLTVIAVRYSGLSFQHLAIALFCGSIAYTWVTYTSIHHRVSGDENAVTFGNGAMLLFVTSFCLMIFEKNKIIRFLLILTSIGYFYASYRSGTRGSFIAFLPLTLFSLYFLRKKQILVFLAALVTAGFIFSYSNIANNISNAYENIISYVETNNYRTSTGARLNMWQAAWCFNQEAPLLGKGPHQFKQSILDPDRTCEISIGSSKKYYVQAHSFYFNALATIGWVGLIGMLAFFFMVGRYSWSLPLIAKVTIPAVILTFLSYSLTVDLFFSRYLADKHLTLLAVLLGISMTYASNRSKSLE